jgi:hypothetical protein
MVWGPLSESYGRKWTMIVSFALFTVFSIASALSPNYAALVVFRLFVGIGGSCAISVVGGICADVYHDPVSRGRSMAIFMVGFCPKVRLKNNFITKDQIGCDDLWAHPRPTHLRLHQCGLVELGFLDRGHIRRCVVAALLLFT